MKTEKLAVSNVKCMGCVSTVKLELASIQGVAGVEVDLPTSVVTVTYRDDSVRDAVLKKLDTLGYPAKR